MEIQNLVCYNSLGTRGTNYGPYFTAIRKAFGEHVTVTGMVGEICRSKFLLHGILVETTMDDITSLLNSNHPQIQLAQTPRWLVTDQIKHTRKKDGTSRAVSTVVIVILCNHSLKFLGATHQ